MLITSLTIMLLVLYTLIAGFAMFMTYDERKRTGKVNAFYATLSILACLVWPLTVVVVAITALALQRRSGTPVPAAKAQTAS